MQVFAGMGINCPDAADSWSVGSTVASMYAKQFGRRWADDKMAETTAILRVTGCGREVER
jgi:hypothetical protein